MSGAAQRCKVAICDDQTAFRNVVKIVLQLDPELDLVGEAVNGEGAVELARDARPNVLLLDIAMPVMDGLEALPLIRAAAPETLVVMLSGIANAAIRERALAAGAVAFVEKGTDVDRIADLVKEIWRTPR